MNALVGRWTHFKTGNGPSFLTKLFPPTAILEIGQDGVRYTVSLDRGDQNLVILSQIEEAPGKLCGRFSMGPVDYYFEVVPLTPISPLASRSPRIYGMVAEIQSGAPGDDLGDPGTWQAEDEGGLGGGRG